MTLGLALYRMASPDLNRALRLSEGRGRCAKPEGRIAIQSCSPHPAPSPTGRGDGP
jgi:hypothetical protein